MSELLGWARVGNPFSTMPLIDSTFALNESLVLKIRTKLNRMPSDSVEREQLQEKLDRYLKAAFIASGPDEERAKSWHTKAVRCEQSLEVEAVGS